MVEVSGEGELSYLILAMQLGVGFAVSISKIITLNKNSLVYGIISLFILYCILTLAGRAALIGCIFVVLSVSFSLMSYHWKRKPLLIAFVYTSISILVYLTVDYLFENVLNEYLLYKLTESSSSSNSRLSYYIQSLNVIANHPFGLGLHKYNSVLGFYPHNIFLEMGMNAGIISMLILMFPFIIFLMKLLSVCINIKKSVCLPLGNLTLFLTFCWMFSNNLASSYPLFTAMIIFFQKESEEAS
ncbi:O-antigen ligase family protein [Vibrio sp. PNB22_4_1]